VVFYILMMGTASRHLQRAFRIDNVITVATLAVGGGVMDAKIVQIGNSKGIRIPKRLLVKYGLGEKVVLREVENGILIEGDNDGKLSWADTYRAMAESEEDWSDWSELELEEVE
jgi:antitoxin MazE